MKLRRIKISNFRGIVDAGYNFCDVFGEVRKITVIVGPNGSGKTAILDAIWFGLMSEIGYKIQREAFRFEAPYVVFSGKSHAQIEYELEISAYERDLINQWQQQLAELGEIEHYPALQETIGKIDWTYPAHPQYQEKGYGGYAYPNGYDWQLARGQDYYRKLQKMNAPHLPKNKLGEIYFFEEERHITAPPIAHYSQASHQSDEFQLRAVLIDFGIKDRMGQFPAEQSWYKRIQKGFNTICASYQMGEVYTTGSADEYEIDFINPEGVHYGFDGLSSGQRSVLNFLTQYLSRAMLNSIVLIDELEAHLHPTWQRRLLNYLQTLDDGNQLIITTHSPTLLEVIPDDSIIELGSLDNIPDWQYEDHNV